MQHETVMPSRPVAERIPSTELLRDPNRVFDAVHHGRTIIIVADEGDSELALIEMEDLRILKAVMEYHRNPPPTEPDDGLSEERVVELSGQALYNVALAHYLSGASSLARTAEVLGTTWIELRTRLVRLDVPLWTAPEDEEGVRQDLLVARSAAAI